RGRRASRARRARRPAAARPARAERARRLVRVGSPARALDARRRRGVPRHPHAGPDGPRPRPRALTLRGPARRRVRHRGRSERLTRAVDRVVERVAGRTASGRSPDGAGSAPASAAPSARGGRSAPPEDETVVVTVGTTTRVVRRSAVRWVQAQGDYSRLVTDTEQFLVREALSDLEERWAPAGFLRVHRSYLVDRSAVTAARFGGTQPALVVAGHEVPVSRRMVPAVREALLGPHRGPS